MKNISPKYLGFLFQLSFRILKAIIEAAGGNINKVEDAADVLESALEAFFRDSIRFASTVTKNKIIVF